MTAQGKTEGRHPGSSLPPTFFTTLKGSHKIRWYVLCRPFRAEYFGGNRVPRVATFVLTLGYYVLPFQGDSAAILKPSSYQTSRGHLTTKILRIICWRNLMYPKRKYKPKPAGFHLLQQGLRMRLLRGILKQFLIRNALP